MSTAIDTATTTEISAPNGFRVPLGLAGETLIFAIASGLDFLLTRHMLMGYGSPARIGQIVESNPIARYILYSWGFDGLFVFKATTVAIVALICHIIAVKRVEVARRLMLFATIAVLSVVTYSMVLMVRSV
ncbi:MAG: DUF5658 family protein [Planctomycetota bacterium]|nr:DUF5658 family protein [Planctomycetota bacterium]